MKVKHSPFCQNAQPALSMGRRFVPPAHLTYKDSSFSQCNNGFVQCMESLELERTVNQLKAQVNKLETIVARMQMSKNMVHSLNQVKEENLTWTPFSAGKPSSMMNMDALLLLPTLQAYIPLPSLSFPESSTACNYSSRCLNLSLMGN